MSEAFVYDAVRLPRGRVRKGGGTLAEIPPYELFGQLLAALEDRGCPPAAVDDVLVGVSTAVGEQGAMSPGPRCCGRAGRIPYRERWFRGCAVPDWTRWRAPPHGSRPGTPT